MALPVNVSHEAWTIVMEIWVGVVLRLWFFCFVQRGGISDRLARLGKSSGMLTFGSTGMGNST